MIVFSKQRGRTPGAASLLWGIEFKLFYALQTQKRLNHHRVELFASLFFDF